VVAPSAVMIFFHCLVVTLLVLSSAGDTAKANEKTTEAVVKAVAKADGKTTEDKAADAVATATMDVIKSESHVGEEMPEDILEKAKKEAKDTFKELKDAKVGTKAAADAAAKVAVAEIDGASDMDVSKDVKANAEKAAVAAGKGIADHPKSEAKALGEAISTVKKEEATPGKVDVTKTEKGMMDKAKETISDLPALAEGAAAAVPHPSSGAGIFGALVCMIAIGGVGITAIRKYEWNLEMKPFEKFGASLMDPNSNHKDVEFGEATYNEMH